MLFHQIAMHLKMKDVLIHIVENQALRHKRIDIWRQVLVATVIRQERRTEALHRHEHDVVSPHRNAVGIGFHAVIVKTAQYTIIFLALFCGKHLIKFVVAE